VSEPSVLREPSEVVQVVDAFDDDDLFDLHLSLGYQSTWKSAKILRESSLTDAGFSDGGFSRANLNVAEYSSRISRLNTRADVGLYKDLALVIRLPIVLSDDRELKGLSGSEKNQSFALAGAPGEQLFQLPFKSPTRSGVEYLAIGLDASPMNQARDSTKPTWLIGIEGRFDVSEPMHACGKNLRALNTNSMLNPGDSQLDCAHRSDINRNGVSGEHHATEMVGLVIGDDRRSRRRIRVGPAHQNAQIGQGWTADDRVGRRLRRYRRIRAEKQNGTKKRKRRHRAFLTAERPAARRTGEVGHHAQRANTGVSYSIIRQPDAAWRNV
jgi:hypothetical protein